MGASPSTTTPRTVRTPSNAWRCAPSSRRRRPRARRAARTPGWGKPARLLSWTAHKGGDLLSFPDRTCPAVATFQKAGFTAPRASEPRSAVMRRVARVGFEDCTARVQDGVAVVARNHYAAHLVLAEGF